jgi:hypothetical protein
MTSVVVRCLGVLTRASNWSRDEEGGEEVLCSADALEFVRSLRELLKLLSAGSEGFNQEVLRGIVLGVLLGVLVPDGGGNCERDSRGAAIVLSVACSSIFKEEEERFSMKSFIQVVSVLLSSSDDPTRRGAIMFVAGALSGEDENVVGLFNKESSRCMLLSCAGAAAVEMAYGEDESSASAALVVTCCAACHDPTTLMCPFFRVLCDTLGRRGGEKSHEKSHEKSQKKFGATLRRLTLTMLRSNASAFRDSVQMLSGTHQSLLQSFVRTSMEAEGECQRKKKKQQSSREKASDGSRKEKRKKKKKEKLKL